MPPAKKRSRKYDPDKTRAAVSAQFAAVREAVAGLTDTQLAGPATGLDGWTVRDLAAHLAMVVESVAVAAEGPEVAPGGPVVGLGEWPFATAAYADDISEDVRTLAASAPVAETLARAADRFGAALPGVPDDKLVPVRVGTMRLADFLVTRTVELVVHTDDLNRATGLAVPYDRQALAACTRLLADGLAAKAPGASTEVRIPPYAVVQCVEGPRHTRGTPPNVVETDPLTWIRLATGRTTWASALDSATVTASGERADLSGLLPLMS
ncbi:maleylpyruvate isomerase family mycothiol-dependent enzyme [Streptomyces liangshanensis]|uniref:Maleylpyruvate isomerase family mycothiol-dependent enzyme n=1 Tax=Streptomyces liangshanensis TaxID=2717324 RepID=A0A6G9H0I7_9ACTN|nr:maleylpyruvate isomerase family mycothiol-dependent enzyme [Streptomyces liangshanensis]QIQ03980.1 maleylpyruvate isomerase family mycothiol-dependent enzyme [Streptomyces liangshanensis]